MKVSEYNKAAFDKQAPLYDAHTYFRSDEEHLIRAYFTDRKAKLLVGGVGGGRTIPRLKEIGFDITAVDISPAMVERCRQKGVAALVMDIQRTTFADGTFDYIFLPFHTISYVDSQQETLEELNRILKPGGTLVFNAPNHFFLKDAVRGSFLKPLRRPVPVTRLAADTVISRQFSYLDLGWIRRVFPRTVVYGRTKLQDVHDPNWKDWLLARMPFFDKSLYFICKK